jgi:hypothetical protein
MPGGYFHATPHVGDSSTTIIPTRSIATTTFGVFCCLIDRELVHWLNGHSYLLHHSVHYGPLERRLYNIKRIYHRGSPTAVKMRFGIKFLHHRHHHHCVRKCGYNNRTSNKNTTSTLSVGRRRGIQSVKKHVRMVIRTTCKSAIRNPGWKREVHIIRNRNASLV